MTLVHENSVDGFKNIDPVLCMRMTYDRMGNEWTGHPLYLCAEFKIRASVSDRSTDERKQEEKILMRNARQL